jgi:hypothetical protein
VAVLGVDARATSALVNAIRQALQNDARFDIQTNSWQSVLLLGLTQGSAEDFERDQTLRASLAASGLAFHVVYGQGLEGVRQALQTLAKHLPDSAAGWLRPEPVVRWSGPCEVCSDADCEHRLFSDLLQRSAARRL